MKAIGLTGGIGMGKSTVAELLRQRGVLVVDTDVIAREVVEPGQPALAEIQAAFGADVIGADGGLRRDEMARRVFGDAGARARLEAILHPRIRVIWQEALAAGQTAGFEFGVAVIPLLFETGVSEHFDCTVCVACSTATQRVRLGARGWSNEQMDQRIRAQLPLEKKMASADFVIWTEGAFEVVGEQLDRILDDMRK